MLPYRVGLGVGVVTLLVVANLRGARESGTLFAVPTYLYLVAALDPATVGLWRTSTGALGPLPVDPAELARPSPVGRRSGWSGSPGPSSSPARSPPVPSR